MEINSLDIEMAAQKLKRYGKEFDLLTEGIMAYEAAKQKRLNEECQTCNGTGRNHER